MLVLDATQWAALWYVGGMMQGAPEMAQGTAKAIYKDVQSVRLDSKLLKTLHPDIYAECSSRTTYKRFSVV
jgi:predicted phage-related endonuclease